MNNSEKMQITGLKAEMNEWAQFPEIFTDLFKGKILLALLLVIIFTCEPASSQPEYSRPLPAQADTNVAIPPAWAFGVMYGSYNNQEESMKLVGEIIGHDYPIDAFWTDSWIWDWQNKGKGPAKYIDFVADTISFPSFQEFWTGFLGEKKIKAGMWVWDCIQKTGNESIFEDFRSKGFFSDEFIHTSGWHNGSMTTMIGDNGQETNGTLTGNIDFENPHAVNYFKIKMKHFFDDGLDFIKLDKTDAIAVCKAMFEMSSNCGLETSGRGFVLSHSGGVENEEYKKYPGKWTDDTRSDWSAEKPLREFSPWLPNVAFRENIRRYTDTTLHFYKIPFLANDMGGFALSTDGFIDEELYIRWTEFALFLPITTVFSQPENQTGNIPFRVSPQADSVFRKYAHLKMKLFPYIYSFAHLARLEGKNIVRPDGQHFYQYMLGDELLVAPVCEQHARVKEVFFPEGNDWFDFFSDKKYAGGQQIRVPAAVGEIPLFAKAGAIIPLRNYCRNIESGSNDTLEIHVFCGKSGSFRLIEDDGKSLGYLKGKYAVTTFEMKMADNTNILNISSVDGNYDGMPGDRCFRVVFHGFSKMNTVLMNQEKTNIFTANGLTFTQYFHALKSDKVSIVIQNRYD